MRGPGHHNDRSPGRLPDLQAGFMRGPGHHNDRSETLDYSFTVYFSSINTSYKYNPTLSRVREPTKLSPSTHYFMFSLPFSLSTLSVVSHLFSLSSAQG